MNGVAGGGSVCYTANLPWPEPVMHTAISARRDALAALCRRFHVRRLEVFGSATSDADFDPGRSDADLLITFEPDAEPGLAGFLDVKEALEHVLGRPVGLVERAAVEQGRNYLRRQRILREAEPIFVAG